MHWNSWQTESRWPKARLRTRRKDGFYSFLSYSRRDEESRDVREFIDVYVDALKQRVEYIPVFLDRFYLDRGEYRDSVLRRDLARALVESDYTTVFLSPGYVNSRWCMYELDHSQQEFWPVCTEKPLPHGILTVTWKRPDDSDFRRLGADKLLADSFTIDVSKQIESRDWFGAASMAADHTLTFWDRFYGE